MENDLRRILTTLQLKTAKWFLQNSVADVEFLKGGFCYTNAREACAYKPRPLLIKPRLFSIVLERNYLSNQSVLIKFSAEGC